MVSILAAMWATAFAQAIIPWYVFIPLFILTQAFLWLCVGLGLVHRVLSMVADAWDEYKSPRQSDWDRYKKTYLR